MLKLDGKLTLTEKAISEPNLTGRLSPEDLDRIGAWVHQGYTIDLRSRADWERRNQAGMDLAMQLQKAKSFPWENCSNVAFPLVTIATLQYHARAYASLIVGTEVVKYRTIGEDPTGEKLARARRIGDHMSWQLLEQDEAWEEQFDRALFSKAIIGCVFKKTYQSAAKGHPISEMVAARDLVLNYWAKSVDSCPRKTHRIYLYRNELYERVRSGVYRDFLDEEWFRNPAVPTNTRTSEDRRTGSTPPAELEETTPYLCLEQHVDLDLDGDGYAEPYIITIEESSRKVLRIVTGFDRPQDIERTRDGKIIRIARTEYFTKYTFIPSPDGGIYDIGFGVFLGPLNEATNSLVNQLIDSGTASTLSGGFLARGAKVRGGDRVISPLEWNRVDMTGDDLRKSMVPFTAPQPSEVLFRLLVLLIEYTSRLAGSTDMVVGESPGQNTPAETSRTVLNEGLRIYSAIFKRTWRGMRAEFRKIYRLNALYLPDTFHFGEGKTVTRADYLGDPTSVAPVADPNVVSDTMRIQTAATVAQRAQAVPGYNKDLVERNLLKAMRVEGAEALFTGSANLPPPGPSEKVQIEMLRAKTAEAQLQVDHMHFLMELQETQRVNTAKIAEMESKVLLLLEQADEVDTSKTISMLQTMIGAMKLRNDALASQIELSLKQLEVKQDGNQTGGVRSVETRPADSGSNVGLPGVDLGLARALG